MTEERVEEIRILTRSRVTGGSLDLPSHVVNRLAAIIGDERVDYLECPAVGVSTGLGDWEWTGRIFAVTTTRVVRVAMDAAVEPRSGAQMAFGRATFVVEPRRIRQVSIADEPVSWLSPSAWNANRKVTFVPREGDNFTLPLADANVPGGVLSELAGLVGCEPRG